MENLEIDINMHEPIWLEIADDIESLTDSVVKAALSRFINPNKPTDISIVLANNDFVQDLNKTYRNKDKPTNVLSFPQTQKDQLDSDIGFCSLGDIIIALETIEFEATEQKKSIRDHYSHMLIHGCLHLLHFDHQCDEEANIMEKHEIEILAELGIKNPYEIR